MKGDTKQKMQSEMLHLQNKQLLNDIIKRNLPGRRIDFIGSNLCSQACTDCYLSNEKNLYPDLEESLDENFEVNLFALLDWYKNLCITNPIGFKNITYFLPYLDKIYKFFTQENIKPQFIIFFTDDSQVIKLEKYQMLFTKIGIPCIINIIIQNTISEELIPHIKENYHLITAHIIPEESGNWIGYYKWWINQLGIMAFSNIILQEDKTDKWDKEAITNYTQFLDFQVDFLYENLSDFQNFIFAPNSGIRFNTVQLIDQGIIDNTTNHRNCDFYNSIEIDVNSACLLLCPKINYEDFTLGTFNLVTQDFDPKNVEASIIKFHLKRSSTPICEKCHYIGFCNGFCYGQSYNKTYNPLIPVLEGCNFTKSKYTFLIYKYELMGLLENIKDYYHSPFYDYFCNLREQVLVGLGVNSDERIPKR